MRCFEIITNRPNEIVEHHPNKIVHYITIA